MKKIFFIAATAAAVFASCAKTEVVQTNTEELTPVTFGVYNGKMATKAVSVTTYGQINTTALLEGSTYGFGVFGFFSDNSEGTNDFNPSSSNFTPNFMYNQQVEHTSGAWDYTPHKYWPNEYSTTTALSDDVDKLTFFAYAPYVATVGDEGITAFSANTATGDPTVSFKVPQASDKQIDLLWSDAATTNLTKQAISGNVLFTFKHALSNLSIYPVAVVDASSIPASSGTNLSTGTTIFVNDITIEGAFSQTGTLNLRTGAWSDKGSSTPSVNYHPTTPLEVTDINDKAEADAGNPCAEFMFIPTAVEGYTVTIDYDVKYAAAQSGLAADLVVNNVIHKNIDLPLDQGKKMKLYIGLGMTSVTFSAEVADWTDAADQTIWLPVNTD